ncbi:tetratricopeptide (TPR) repeat protein [Streptosporangium album]|uniref:Tetratricopeptide (TPR) repeat protein n=1 Tax=Streptosporangium album TaxID=47479 RepID=A0A7W7RQA0_9ACTN|nr:CHAT domain-containing protein [Streptosporangium album]MBB4936214.1 tetratricopeptide (TPR) repeat protein [Streptosporangium album]
MITDAVAAAEHAVNLSSRAPARALALARGVLRHVSAADPHGEAAAIAYRALAVAARELGDLPLAEEHLRQAVSIAVSAGLPHRAAQARLSLVHIRTELGHPQQALTIADAAEPHLTPVEVAKLGVHRAVALARLGRYAEAVGHCDRAVEALGDDVGFLAGAMLNRGLARVFLGDFEAAEADLTRCVELARAAGLDHVLTLAEGNLPFLAARRGDLPGAFTAYRRAESSLAGYPERLATMRCDLAEALIAAHLPGEARVLLDLAVPELAAAGANTVLAEARLLLAQAELCTGDPHLARQSAERAAADLAAQDRTVLAPLATEILLRVRLMLGPPTGELLAELLSCAEALDAAGHRQSSRALRFAGAEVALQLGARPTADGQLARLASSGPDVVARQATALRRALAGDRRGAFAAVRAGLVEVGANATAFEDPMLRAHAVRAGEPLARFGLALALKTGRGRTLLAWAERWRAVAGGAGRPVAPDLDELRTALGDAALVEFVRHTDELVAVVVTRDRVMLRRLGPFAAAAEATVRLRYGLRRAHLLDGRAPGLAGEAALLERLLFGSVRDRLDHRPLVIVPTGALYTLPWPILPMNSERPVTVAAGAAAWLAGHRMRAVRERGVVAVAGPGLRCAEAEADMVRSCHPGAERVAALRAEVLATLDRAHVAHLAAHGMFSPRSPLLSGIDLDDGPLMAYDLLRLRTPPPLVVLSACDTGMARAPADGAPLGLAGTFLSLGSQCVVASLVPVRDEETLTLMTVFHGLLAAGHPPAQALTMASGKTGVDGFVCFGYGDQPVATGREGSATQLDQDPT